ncbi:MAG TPA: hypothetical protein PLV68_12070, partial [Ilumatobacteraceae bacterium]|nr:hypothetical protein [Ilumatobacteraceae bacterium]
MSTSSTAAPATTTTVAESVPPTDTAVPTTDSTPPTEPPPPPSTNPLPPGWQPIDFWPASGVQGYSGNWCCTASPPAPASPDQSPADGYYPATYLTPWQPGDTAVHLQVQ